MIDASRHRVPAAMELYSFAYYTYKQQRSKQNNRYDAKLSDEREKKHLPVTN